MIFFGNKIIHVQKQWSKTCIATPGHRNQTGMTMRLFHLKFKLCSIYYLFIHTFDLLRQTLAILLKPDGTHHLPAWTFPMWGLQAHATEPSTASPVPPPRQGYSLKGLVKYSAMVSYAVVVWMRNVSQKFMNLNIWWCCLGVCGTFSSCRRKYVAGSRLWGLISLPLPPPFPLLSSLLLSTFPSPTLYFLCVDKNMMGLASWSCHHAMPFSPLWTPFLWNTKTK